MCLRICTWCTSSFCCHNTVRKHLELSTCRCQIRHTWPGCRGQRRPRLDLSTCCLSRLCALYARIRGNMRLLPCGKILELGLLCAISIGYAAASDRTFTIEADHFVKDGKPTQLISGRHVRSSLGASTTDCNDVPVTLVAYVDCHPRRLSPWPCLTLLDATPDIPRCRLLNVLLLQFLKFHKVCACSVHYHRIPLVYWRDRLLRVRSNGLNTIEVEPLPFYMLSCV